MHTVLYSFFTLQSFMPRNAFICKLTQLFMVKRHHPKLTLTLLIKMPKSFDKYDIDSNAKAALTKKKGCCRYQGMLSDRTENNLP